MNNLHIQQDSQICLRSHFSSKCVGASSSEQGLFCNFPPSYVSTGAKSHSSITFKIMLKESMNKAQLLGLYKDSSDKKREQIKDGCKVLLINAENKQLLASTAEGQVKFQKMSSNEEMNKNLLKEALWTIHLAQHHDNTEHFLTVFDLICLRSVTNKYLTVGNGYQCVAREEVDLNKYTWSIIKADVPFIPSWIYERPAFSKFMKSKGAIAQKDRKVLKAHPVQTQEALLIEDILDIMLGFDGVYIKKRQNLNQFGIQTHLDTPTANIALAQLTMKILALPSCYYSIQEYISTYSIQQGTVCQALCGGLRVLVKEYKMMVIQLDEEIKNGLSLQKIWYFIQPSLKIMENLADLIRQTQNLKGGQLISCILKILNENTDEQVVSIYKFLFGKAINLYVKMVSKWIYQGSLEDKHEEFMIMPDKDTIGSPWDNWQSKYVLRKDQIPTLFAKESQMILVTGKYLNIIKACGKQIVHPFEKEIEHNLETYIRSQNFMEPIEKAYRWANQQLKALVFNEYKLVDVLRSIKGYFFLEYGDLFVHFMDSAEQQLSTFRKTKEFKQFPLQKLQSLFELLIRTSSANNDQFKDEVSCKIDLNDIYEHVKRIKSLQPSKLNYDYNQKPFIKKDSRYVDFFTLNYRCCFPLNLIINQNSIAKYQAIFRLLFWSKFTQRQLCSVWLALQTSKEPYLQYYRPAYMLTQQMIGFIKNLIYYLSYQVIQENWQNFMVSLEKVSNFEELIDNQSAFLNKCMVQSLLTSHRILPIITADLGNICLGFFMIRDYINKLHKRKQPEFIYYPNSVHSVLTQRRLYIRDLKDSFQNLLEAKDFQKFVEGFAANFDQAMRNLLRQLQGTAKSEGYLVNLLSRLDEDNYYSKKLLSSSPYALGT